MSERTLERLRRGESVRVRLDRSNVVGGVARRAGRRPGRSPRRDLWFRTGRPPSPGTVPARFLLRVIENGGTVTSRQARFILRGGRPHASQMLGQLAAAGLLRREQWARYTVTPKGLAARAALSEEALYRAGTHRRRLAEWAMAHGTSFGVADVSALLGIARGSAHNRPQAAPARPRDRARGSRRLPGEVTCAAGGARCLAKEDGGFRGSFSLSSSGWPCPNFTAPVSRACSDAP